MLTSPDGDKFIVQYRHVLTPYGRAPHAAAVFNYLLATGHHTAMASGDDT